MGYSMGGFITLRLLHDNPARVRRADRRGRRQPLRRGRLETDAIVEGLRARDASAIAAPWRASSGCRPSRQERPEALALCMTRRRRFVRGGGMKTLGGADADRGRRERHRHRSAACVAKALPGARVVIVPKRSYVDGGRQG
jgi:pimeloyl-ACP methyl ester carboxylesterase